MFFNLYLFHLSDTLTEELLTVCENEVPRLMQEEIKEG
jgi:hypothetical protein